MQYCTKSAVYLENLGAAIKHCYTYYSTRNELSDLDSKHMDELVTNITNQKEYYRNVLSEYKFSPNYGTMKPPPPPVVDMNQRLKDVVNIVSRPAPANSGQRISAPQNIIPNIVRMVQRSNVAPSQQQANVAPSQQQANVASSQQQANKNIPANIVPPQQQENLQANVVPPVLGKRENKNQSEEDSSFSSASGPPSPTHSKSPSKGTSKSPKKLKIKLKPKPKSKNIVNNNKNKTKSKTTVDNNKNKSKSRSNSKSKDVSKKQGQKQG